MTTLTTLPGNGYLQAYSGVMGSSESLPSTSKAPIIYDLRGDDLPLSGTDEEFDIDEYINAEDEVTQKAVAEAGSWVADNFYQGQETLATLRLRAGLSQAKFGELIGQAQPHVSRYESGMHEPGVILAARMAKVLNISLEQLVLALTQSATTQNK